MNANFQAAVRQWVLHCFGQEVADDKVTRCFRFFEEASELCQSLGMDKEDALKLIDYVWSRPVGEPHQEMGGVKVTLAALATPCGLDMEQDGWVELSRCWANTDKIRAKQKAKAAIGLGAKGSPEPGNADIGKWVTLFMAYGDSTFMLPQQTKWRIIAERGTDWIVIDQEPGGLVCWPGEYALPKRLCSEPRTVR